MTCHEAQEAVLASLDETLSALETAGLEAHLSGCDDCRDFRAAQVEMDRELSAALPPPELTPGFRAALRKQIRREPTRPWPDLLPDILHVGGCVVATLICALTAPVPIHVTITTGTLVTAASYLLQIACRAALEEVEE